MRKQVFAWATDHWQLATDESFIYNGWEVIEVVDALAGAAGELLTQYTWGLDLSGSLQGAGGIGGLLACEWPQTTGESKKYWFFYDANGNVGQLLRYRTTGGDSITPAARYEYDPYGGTIAALDMDAQSDPGAAAANPFRFSTKWLDHEPATTNPAGAVGTTGLYYYGYRYYSPGLGRWISRDPIGEEGGNNLLAFVSNQPTNSGDALGLDQHHLRQYMAHSYIFVHQTRIYKVTRKGDPPPQFVTSGAIEVKLGAWSHRFWGRPERSLGQCGLLWELDGQRLVDSGKAPLVVNDFPEAPVKDALFYEGRHYAKRRDQAIYWSYDLLPRGTNWGRGEARWWQAYGAVFAIVATLGVVTRMEWGGLPGLPDWWRIRSSTQGPARDWMLFVRLEEQRKNPPWFAVSVRNCSLWVTKAGEPWP